ncbi:MAG: cation-translocating P-type ATPase [Deltaproteobacteria bacterium]|nr:MAG: cation-translocating P-type ATPase [Deltaproteobacteria bacterium]
MNPTSDRCDLCGLSLRYQQLTARFSEKTFHFCCQGCKQVFHMLMEATDSPDPASFRQTELFRKCQEIGIIPKSEGELAERAGGPEAVVSAAAGEVQEPPELMATYDETYLSLNLHVHQMWCPACAWVIEETLKRSPGIASASCNFATDRVRCDYNPVVTSPREIIGAINSLGYEASLPGEGREAKDLKAELIRFVVSAFLTMNVMMLSFALYSGFFTELSRDHVHKLSWPIFVMASVVLFYGGRNIYRRAWAGITTAAFSMETLITVGSFSAYFYSIYGLLSASIHLYFDTASMLITLVLLGKLLERRAKDEVQEDLANFFSLRPTKVRICSEIYPDGRYVDAQYLIKGDTFRVEENEILPADGLILGGKGIVDESSLTGEPLPIKKKTGDRIKSGSRVIQGIFTVKAEGVGEDSIVGQMITIMEQALGKRTPFEGKAERALQWFVPVVLALAAGTGLLCLLFGLTAEESLIRAVTVTVISCPCTLGIAIPMARLAGISLAGRKGILVRDFTSFEQADRVNSFVLDKTGTVTKGQWSLLEVVPVGPFSTEKILGLAAALEKESDHLIAAEITREAAKHQAELATLQEREAFENGISAVFNGEKVKIGSRGFLADEIETAPDLPLPENKPEHSLVFMSFADKLCGIFIFGDEIKSTTTQAVKCLREAKYQVALISGDDDLTTKTIAGEVGIQEALGGRLPQEKAIYISVLQKQGLRVAMVGDGINDAPALVQADLAIAVHSGSHLGKEAADLTLMRGDPLQICDFIELAGKVKKKVHQNLGCSFIYNLVSIPIAMSGLLTPLIAVSAMLLSSLSVIGNTLLLLKKD